VDEGAVDVVCAGEETVLLVDDDVVFDGCAKLPVMLTCRIGPGARLVRTYDGFAVQTVWLDPQTKSAPPQLVRN
jgi:hypothetical protein